MLNITLDKKTYPILLISRIPIVIICLLITFFNLYFRTNLFMNISTLNQDIAVLIRLADVSLNIICWVIVGILLFYYLIQPFFLIKNTKLEIMPTHLKYQTGVLFFKETFIPLTSIQQSELTTNVIKQLFNTSSISISTSFITLTTGPINHEECLEVINYILKKRDNIEN